MRPHAWNDCMMAWFMSRYPSWIWGPQLPLRPHHMPLSPSNQPTRPSQQLLRPSQLPLRTSQLRKPLWDLPSQLGNESLSPAGLLPHHCKTNCLAYIKETVRAKGTTDHTTLLRLAVFFSCHSISISQVFFSENVTDVSSLKYIFFRRNRNSRASDLPTN